MCCQFDQLDLRQFQRQGSRSLLSLGTIFADVHITDQKADVVPVRPHRCTLHPQISLPVPVQCLFKWQISRTWLVYDLQAFFTAGQSLVNLCNDPIDLFDKFFSSGNQPFPILYHLQLPYFQCIRKIFLSAETELFQQMVSLIHDPVVIRQIIQVHLIKLRKLQIYESSSLCRPVLDNVQIFRREKYKIHNSEKFACLPDRHLIDGNPFRTVLLQVHIDLITDSVLFHHGFDV